MGVWSGKFLRGENLTEEGSLWQVIKPCSFQVALEMGLWAELIEGDTGTQKKKIMKEEEKRIEFIGKLLKRKEGGVEGKQSIPIYKVGSLAN